MRKRRTDRDVQHVRYSVIGATENPNATVLTYGTRPAGSGVAFTYKTVILGRWFADRAQFKTWMQGWPDEDAALAGHLTICDALHRDGPDAPFLLTLQ